MSENDSDVPVADDAFPEFAQAPRQRPPEGYEAAHGEDSRSAQSDADARQAGVDEVLERLRRQRAEGTD